MSTPIIRVSAVVLRDPHGRVLTVRKKGTSTFMFPGGKPEAGESAADAAVREVREEVGLPLSTDDLIELGTFTTAAANEAHHRVEAVVFAAPLTGAPQAAAEIAELAWVDPRHLGSDHSGDLPGGLPGDLSGNRSLAPLLTDAVLPALAHHPVRFLAVFMGARLGVAPANLRLAQELGTLMASNNTRLIYGGGKVGLMGAVADAVIEAGGHATGVIPQHLVDREVAHPGLTTLEIVPTLNARKQRMSELADGFVCLPGGAGTLDEFFDAWTGQQLGEHTKPIALLGREFWAPTLAMLDHMVTQGYIRSEDRDSLIVADTAEELFTEFAAWQPPPPKWA
ncbi:TIGR00730 family Rossman fold protein [Corynebacterium falsenii]|uniref:TIGR00730 family Rossman fold protein n=1 Tax=Corynebacterium falsenii TaxID=108486 RepID=UPI00234CB3CC|nr:TIGR00730 family Rossman fold protein [Corynebacterium falsenii]MDC7103628.1 TIGR00730 family Rossman fold protein [Corynebacterium falsenii]